MSIYGDHCSDCDTVHHGACVQSLEKVIAGLQVELAHEEANAIEGALAHIRMFETLGKAMDRITALEKAGKKIIPSNVTPDMLRKAPKHLGGTFGAAMADFMELLDAGRAGPAAEVDSEATNILKDLAMLNVLSSERQFSQLAHRLVEKAQVFLVANSQKPKCVGCGERDGMHWQDCSELKRLRALSDKTNPRCQKCRLPTDSGPGDWRCDCPKEKPATPNG